MIQYGVRWYGEIIKVEDVHTKQPYSLQDVLEKQERFKNATAVSRYVGDWEEISTEVVSSGGELKGVA